MMVGNESSEKNTTTMRVMSTIDVLQMPTSDKVVMIPPKILVVGTITEKPREDELNQSTG
jgi:hypothetical protein